MNSSVDLGLFTLEGEIKILKSAFPIIHKRFRIHYATTEELRCKFICDAGRLHKITARIPKTYPFTPPLWYTDDKDMRIINAVQMLSTVTEVDKHLIITQVYLLLKELYQPPTKIPELHSSLIGTVGCRPIVNSGKNIPPMAPLQNIGNTCFLNSVLYTLRFAPSFLHKLHHLKSNEEICLNEDGSRNETITSCLHELYANLYDNEHNNWMEPYKPYKLLQLMRKMDTNYEGNQEHDAQELLGFLLNAIQETKQKTQDKGTNNETVAESFHPDSKCTQVRQSLTDGNTTSASTKDESHGVNQNILLDDFQGVALIRTICLECESASVVRENIWPSIISFPIVKMLDGVDENRIIYSLFKFVILTKEYFRSNNKVLCERCLHTNEAKQEYEYEKLPRLLTLHLKRFSTFGNDMGKINNYMPSPFTLPCYCKECENTARSSERPHSYTLYSIIVHIGRTISTGHYKSFVRRLKGSQGNYLMYLCDQVETLTLSSDFDAAENETSRAHHYCKGLKCCSLKLRGQEEISQDAEEIWFECSDSQIRALSSQELKDILSPYSSENEGMDMTPYLLFYARIDA